MLDPCTVKIYLSPQAVKFLYDTYNKQYTGALEAEIVNAIEKATFDLKDSQRLLEVQEWDAIITITRNPITQSYKIADVSKWAPAAG